MAKQPDLSKFSMDELKELRRNVDKEIANFDKKKKAEALKAVQAVAKEHGVSLEDLMGKKAKARGGAAPAKYRNPDDPTQTWSGRGRQPQWFKDHLTAGVKPEKMEI